MKDEKDLNSTKMDQRGKNPGKAKKKKIPDRSMWDLWWAKWHWDRFFYDISVFSCQFYSTGVQRCSIKTEKQKKTSPSSSQGCTISLQGRGVSVASAAGPFNNNNNIIIIRPRLFYNQLNAHLMHDEYKVKIPRLFEENEE
jgi:hypothetical protein